MDFFNPDFVAEQRSIYEIVVATLHNTRSFNGCLPSQSRQSGCGTVCGRQSGCGTVCFAIYCLASFLYQCQGMQVPPRYSDQCQGYVGTPQVFGPVSGVCRYPAGIRTSVRGMQVPLRYSDQCQGYVGTPQVFGPVSGVCRYPPGIRTSARGM